MKVWTLLSISYAQDHFHHACKQYAWQFVAKFYNISPVPTYIHVIGQFCARHKVCGILVVLILVVHSFAYFTFVQNVLLCYRLASPYDIDWHRVIDLKELALIFNFFFQSYCNFGTIRIAIF